MNFIQAHFDIISVCPEVEIGLSVPRPPVQLVKSHSGELRILGRDNPSIDITDDMQKYCQHRPPLLDSIHGYIFKSKSPSCGIQNVPLFNTTGAAKGMTRGMFASAILQHYPELPITDELHLTNQIQLEQFLKQTQNYQHRI